MVNVRPATPEDADAIAELSRILARHVEDSDPGPDATEILSAGFGPDRWFNCLLAEDLFRVVGFALYCRRFDAHTRTRRLWLADLVVAPDRQRLGIGRVLVEALRREAIRLQCEGIALEIWKQNHSARSFYKQIGAVPADDIEVWKIPEG